MSYSGRYLSQIGLVRPRLVQTHLTRNAAFPLNFRRGLQAQARTTQRTWSAQRGTRVLFAGTVASLGLGISVATGPKIMCEGPTSNITSSGGKEVPDPGNSKKYPPPESSVSRFELTFGAVTGICAGVFVKKGAKAVAWFLGGVFVLLQYLGSKSVIKVDWGTMTSRFENAAGKAKPQTVLSLWRWLIDFLTADFPPRASFIAGFALGLRIG